jgi:hypothetical protein
MISEQYKSCIEACVQCAQECEQCADACLSEQDVKKMAECIRLDRDCAERATRARSVTVPFRLVASSGLARRCSPSLGRRLPSPALPR